MKTMLATLAALVLVSVAQNGFACEWNKQAEATPVVVADVGCRSGDCVTDRHDTSAPTVPMPTTQQQDCNSSNCK